jgi:YaiO family outer membrane protein
MKILTGALIALATATPALAAEKQTVTLSAQSQDFDSGLGSQRTVTLEYAKVAGENTFVLAPMVGQRRAGGKSDTAVGFEGEVYHDWSKVVSTRTSGFVAENKTPFAQWSFGQDVSVTVASATSLTVGGRYARYFGNTDVAFVSAGVRRYFKRGSVAYRMTWTKPDFRSGYLAHLVSATLNDASGEGKTQIWASYGAASLAPAQVPDSFRGKDLGLLLQRVQPVGSGIDVLIRAGVSRYDRPAGDVTATTVGLGLRLAL